MINVNEKYEEVFYNIKTYINKFYNNVKVIKHRAIKLEYPCIVVEQNANTINYSTKDLYKLEKIRDLSFEITIYAIDDLTTQKSSFEICEALEQKVCEVMEEFYNMQGGCDARIARVNQDGATQFTLHYMCQWYMQKNKVY